MHVNQNTQKLVLEPLKNAGKVLECRKGFRNAGKFFKMQKRFCKIMGKVLKYQEKVGKVSKFQERFYNDKFKAGKGRKGKGKESFQCLPNKHRAWKICQKE